MEAFAAIARELARATGSPCQDSPAGRVAGGSISVCYRWLSDAGPLFVKVAAREALPMLGRKPRDWPSWPPQTPCACRGCWA